MIWGRTGKQFAERIKIAQLVIGDNASWGLVQYHADIPAELVPFAVHQIVGTLGRARPFKLRQNVSKKISNDVRDLNIVKAIKFVCKEFGFKPFQSKKTGDKHTACSIVAKALNGLGVKSLHERGVRAIWESEIFHIPIFELWGLVTVLPLASSAQQRGTSHEHSEDFTAD